MYIWSHKVLNPGYTFKYLRSFFKKKKNTATSALPLTSEIWGPQILFLFHCVFVSSATKVENQCTSHLYLQMVSSLISLCTLEITSNCLLNQSELNVLYIATTLITYCLSAATSPCLCTCAQESSVAGWAQEISLQVSSLYLLQSSHGRGTVHGFSVSLFTPPL